MAWTYAFLNMCELEIFHESYSSGILPDKIWTLQLLWKWEVNETLCIGEVGVDLELCVHAHGPDVELIIKASCNNNYFLDMISSSICVLILLQSWFRPCSPLNTISRASLSTCLLQSNTPVQPLLWSVIEYYPPGISRLSWNCITSYEFFIKCYLPTGSNFSRALSY